MWRQASFGSIFRQELVRKSVLYTSANCIVTTMQSSVDKAINKNQSLHTFMAWMDMIWKPLKPWKVPKPNQICFSPIRYPGGRSFLNTMSGFKEQNLGIIHNSSVKSLSHWWWCRPLFGMHGRVASVPVLAKWIVRACIFSSASIVSKVMSTKHHQVPSILSMTVAPWISTSWQVKFWCGSNPDVTLVDGHCSAIQVICLRKLLNNISEIEVVFLRPSRCIISFDKTNRLSLRISEVRKCWEEFYWEFDQVLASI